MKIKDKNIIVVGLLCALASVITFGMFILKSGGFFTVAGDFETQQLTFNILLNEVIKKGGIDSYTWNLDLGTSTVQGFSFYELGSVFFWISMIFPAKMFPYLVGWIYCLKYCVAGVCSYLYLRSYVKEKKWAIIGAILYAFSGYQATNLMFYHFHDVVAFFPLLLLGFDRLMDNKRQKALFVFAVFINCITNYFFFVMEVVFLILYFLIRYFYENKKIQIERVWTSLISGAWGIAMAAVLFLPNVIYIMGNQRSEMKFDIRMLVGNLKYYFYIVKGMLFSADAMGCQSAIYREDWTSTSCYIPVIGISFAVAYVAKKRDWLSRILVIMTIISFSPLLNSMFLLFTKSKRRWWYMFILMVVAASVQVLDAWEEYKTKRYLGIIAMTEIVFFIGVVLVSKLGILQIQVYDKVHFGILFAISFGGIVSILLTVKKRFRYDVMLAITMIGAVLSTATTLYFYQNNETEYIGLIYEKFVAGSQLDKRDEQYRYALNDNILGLVGEASGLGVFSSTVSNSITTFDELFGFYSPVSRLDKTSIEGLAQLLGGKYIVSTEKKDLLEVNKFKANGTQYYVYEQDACPIGYAVDYYITKSDLMKYETNERPRILLNAAVIDDDDTKRIGGKLERFKFGEQNSHMKVQEAVIKNVEQKVNKFERDSDGMKFITSYENDSFVYLSVPYDEGWHVEVDGVETSIINSGGMMLINVPGGKHNVRFQYSTPYYKIGCMISLVSIMGFVMYLIVNEYLKNKKEKDNE